MSPIGLSLCRYGWDRLQIDSLLLTVYSCYNYQSSAYLSHAEHTDDQAEHVNGCGVLAAAKCSPNGAKCSLNGVKCSLNGAKCSLNGVKYSLNDASDGLERLAERLVASTDFSNGRDVDTWCTSTFEEVAKASGKSTKDGNKRRQVSVTCLSHRE